MSSVIRPERSSRAAQSKGSLNIFSYPKFTLTTCFDFGFASPQDEMKTSLFILRFDSAHPSTSPLRGSAQGEDGVLILNRTQLIQLVRRVTGGDLTHGAGQAADHEAVGHDVIAFVAHAAQQLTVGDACGGEEYIF